MAGLYRMENNSAFCVLTRPCPKSLSFTTGCLFSFRPPAEVPGVRGAPAGEALDMTVPDIAFEREDGQLSLF